MKFTLSVQKLAVKTREGPDFRDLSFELGFGEAVAVTSVGPAELRKLLEVLAGLQRPTDGKVYWHRLAPLNVGKSGKTSRFRLYRTIRGLRLTNAYVSGSVALFNDLSVFDNIALPLRYHFSPPERIVEERTERLIDLLRLADVADEKPTNLHLGILQRAALGRALILEPTILFLDSPLSDVDTESARILFSVLKHYLKKIGLSVLATSYEPLSLLPLVSRVLVLFNGNVAHVLEGSDLGERAFLENMNRFYEEFQLSRRRT